MELFLLPSFPILFSLVLFLIMVTKFRNIVKRESSTRSRLPPGPWKLPLIGNMHQMIGLLPHHTLKRLSDKHGPLMHLQLGEVSTVVVSSLQMAKEVMKTHDVKFAYRPEIPFSKIIFYDATDIVFSPYGSYWRKLRRICATELLSKGRVESFQSIREEEASSMVESIAAFSAAGTVINLTEKLNWFSSGVTSRASFGKKSDEQELFVACVEATGKLLGSFHLSDSFPSSKILLFISGMESRLQKIHTSTDRLLEIIINDHKTAARARKSTKNGIGEGEEHVDDLLDVLLKYQDGEDPDFSLTSDNIKAVILNMFIAGTDTSAATTEWAMAEMLKNPRVMKKAQEEVRQVIDEKGKIDEADFHQLKYLKLVIKEVLRLHPPVPLLAQRECRERCEIDGYEIPVKTKVLVNAWAIGRSTDYWTDPDSFYPERFEGILIDYNGTSFEYVPFGAGRRMCPGIIFGVMNVESMLVHLLYHFDWELPDGMKPEDFDMTEACAATVKRKKNSPLFPLLIINRLSLDDCRKSYANKSRRFYHVCVKCGTDGSRHVDLIVL